MGAVAEFREPPSPRRANSHRLVYLTPMKTLLLFFAVLAGAQTFPASGPQCSGPLFVSPVVGTFRYSALSCDIPLTNGTYPVSLTVIENRAANGSDGAVGARLRVFSFSLNGALAGPLDPFAAVGAQKPYVVSLQVPVTDGHLRIISVPQVGNPTLVSVTVGPVVPPPPVLIPTLQPSEISNVSCLIVQMVDGSQRCLPIGAHLNLEGAALNVSFVIAPSVADWRVCNGSQAGSKCDGINYVALVHADGSPATPMLAVPAPVALDLGANWAPVK